MKLVFIVFANRGNKLIVNCDVIAEAASHDVYYRINSYNLRIQTS